MTAALFRPSPADTVARYLGPAPGRRGSRGAWWPCPFHPDRNPSLLAGEAKWKCYGCGVGGDAIEFVRRHLNCSFPEALAELGLGDGPRPRGRPRPAPRPPREPAAPPQPKGWGDLAARIVAASVEALWGPHGGEALEYLRGERLLSDETIRAAGLGFNADWLPLPDDLKRPGEDRRPSLVPGITIPCYGSGGVELVNVRRPAGSDPKYIAMRGSRRGGIFPSAASIKPGRPLVIVEGEFDALLLGQHIGDVASVVTIGSASAAPSRAARDRLMVAPVVFAAHDADEAGDEAASRLTLRSRRERPPGAKDWTEAARNGVDLRAWWAPLLGIRDEGPASGGSEPFSITPLPSDPVTRAAVLMLDDADLELWDERSGFLEADGMERAEAERHALRQLRPDLLANDSHPGEGTIRRGAHL